MVSALALECSTNWVMKTHMFTSHLTSHYFLSRVKMNSTNWSAPNIWAFIAQLVKPSSANAEATVSNPVEALKIFFGLNFAIAWIASTTIPAVHMNFISQNQGSRAHGGKSSVRVLVSWLKKGRQLFGRKISLNELEQKKLRINDFAFKE